MTNVQAERKLRAEAVSAFHTLADEDDENDTFELKKRDIQQDEGEDDSEEYRKFLLEMGGGEEEVRRVLGTSDRSEPDYRNGVEEEEGEEEEERVHAARRSHRKVKGDDDFLMK